MDGLRPYTRILHPEIHPANVKESRFESAVSQMKGPDFRLKKRLIWGTGMESAPSEGFQADFRQVSGDFTDGSLFIAACDSIYTIRWKTEGIVPGFQVKRQYAAWKANKDN